MCYSESERGPDRGAIVEASPASNKMGGFDKWLESVTVLFISVRCSVEYAVYDHWLGSVLIEYIRRISLCDLNCIDAGAGILINGAGVSVCHGARIRRGVLCACVHVCTDLRAGTAAGASALLLAMPWRVHILRLA